MPKIVVIGGTGLVGNALIRAWRDRGSEVAGATFRAHPASGFLQLDMREAPRVRAVLSDFKPDLVAVPAANPYVDYCQLHPEETRAVNVTGTLNVARACRELGARMVFFSSDYVFDGKKGVYSESDPPSPINEYGRQKAETEQGVLDLDSRNLVIRTSGAYGWQWEHKNFVLQVRRRLSAGQTMTVANDISYNPTYVENLAEVTVALMEKGASGVYHVVGAEEIRRDLFARRAAEAFGLDPKLIIGRPAAELQSPTPRPPKSSLRTDKVRAAVEPQPVGVAEGLRRMLAFAPAWHEYAKTLPQPAHIS